MENKQYSIGEFAAMNKVSARMLRHYDKIGLLRSDRIMPSGYRCYREEQIGTISQIKRLRSCGFLLDEIGGILRNDNQQFLAEKVRGKLVELQGQAIQQQNEMRSLSELMKESGRGTPPFTYGVSLSMRRDAILLAPKEMLAIDNVEDAFDGLFRLLHRKKLSTIGCALLLNCLNDQDENRNLVGVPVPEPYSDESYHTFPMPSTPAISVIHYGDYYKIGHAYSALLKFAEQYAYSLDDKAMERYFIDSSHGASPNEYVTEISVALKNTP